MFFRHLPNLLSVVRLLLIPIIWHLYLAAELPSDFLTCGVLLVISGITDIADGVIARKFNLISDVGKVLDPVADKLTQLAVALVLCIRHRWMWPLLALLLVKDATMAILGFYLYRRYGQIGSARWYGKVAPIIYYVVIIGVVAFPNLLAKEHLTLPLYLIIGSMLFAGIMYGISASHFLLHSRKVDAENPEKVDFQRKMPENNG
ncbi:MAG: CDP-alcohol phosphatidyltransferase family protein [Angelakisella sp.]